MPLVSAEARTKVALDLWSQFWSVEQHPPEPLLMEHPHEIIEVLNPVLAHERCNGRSVVPVTPDSTKLGMVDSMLSDQQNALCWT